MELQSTAKKAVQLLLQQHKLWKDDVTKFIALYGEGIPCGAEYENEDIKYNDKNAKKSERALEERLRAIMEDFHTFIEPILGPNSKLRKFINDNSPTPSSTLLLLFDPSLQMLPWEG